MLKSVYQGGSSVILPKANDVDYFYYYETRKERLEALQSNTDHSVDKHFKLWENRVKIIFCCYLYPYMKHIDGEEISEFADFNICDHKAEYVEEVRHFVETADSSNKKWYHILIACYMFENGKNGITKEQLNKAQQVHDNGISDYLKKKCKQILFTN